jgi:hypothetical protein
MDANAGQLSAAGQPNVNAYASTPESRNSISGWRSAFRTDKSGASDPRLVIEQQHHAVGRVDEPLPAACRQHVR